MGNRQGDGDKNETAASPPPGPGASGRAPISQPDSQPDGQTHGQTVRESRENSDCEEEPGSEMVFDSTLPNVAQGVAEADRTRRGYETPLRPGSHAPAGIPAEIAPTTLPDDISALATLAISPGDPQEHTRRMPTGASRALDRPGQPPAESSIPREDHPHLPTIPRTHYGPSREIARGGLGRVSVAEDQRLGREVAIKELLEQSIDLQARFLREALITARLEHPSIVPIYEAGFWPDDTPFYVMKLLAGSTLTQLLTAAEGLEARLAYLPNAIATVDAVAYAHSKGIIHRDIKPSNVVVGDFGETIVVDWGLAKDLDGDIDELAADEVHLDAGTDLTVMGAVMGTPSYMAPEQASGAEVDQQADIYALGAILYQIVTGIAPHQGNSAQEVLERVRKENPRPILEREPDAPEELVTIIEKAMARLPGDRYQSARNLSDDLKRFQSGQRVSVHHYSLGALIKRWLDKNRALVAVAATLLTILALTAVVSVWRIVEESELARARYVEARDAREREVEQNHRLVAARAGYEDDATAALAWLKTLPQDTTIWPTAHLVAIQTANRGIAQHVWRDHESVVYDIALSRDGAMLVSVSQDQTAVLRNLLSGRAVRLRGHTDWVHHASFSPVEPTVATASRDGTVRLWNYAGETIATFDDHDAPINRAVYSPDGRYLATGDDDGVVKLRDLASDRVSDLTKHQGRVWTLAFSPDGAWLATGSFAGDLSLWPLSPATPDSPTATRVTDSSADSSADSSGQKSDILAIRSGERRLLPHRGEVRHLVYSRDGERLVSAGSDGRVHVWDIATATPLTTFDHPSGVRRIQLSDDGTWLVSACRDGVIRVWDVASGEARTLGRHDGVAYSVALSPDQSVAAASGADGAVRIWDVATGLERRTYRGNQDMVLAVLFSPDGKTLWSAGRSTGVRQWAYDEQQTHQRLSTASDVASLEYSPDGGYLASGEVSGAVILWHLASGRRHTIARHEDDVDGLAFSPDGALIASSSWDGGVRVHDRARAVTMVEGAHADRVSALAFLPDNRTLATASRDGTLRRWDAITGRHRKLRGHQGRVESLAVALEGDLMASVGEDGVVQLWRDGSDQPETLGRHDGAARYAVFSPDGERLVTTGADKTVRVWYIDSGEHRVLRGHQHPVAKAVFSPDGEQLVSLGRGANDVLWWDPLTRESQRLDIQYTRSAAFSPDGALLATVSEDGMFRLWDTASRQGHVIHQLPFAAANTVVFAPDGLRMATGDRLEGIDLWRDDVPYDVSSLYHWLQNATSAEIDVGRVLMTPSSAR